MKKALIISTCIISAIIFLFCSCSEYGTSVQIIDDNASLSINDDDFSRTKYINSIEEYEAVLLSKANGAIDFDNEMVVVYSFEDINQRELKIQSVSVSDDFAEIVLAHKKDFPA